MTELYVPGIGYLSLGKTLRVSQRSVWDTDVVIVGPLIAVEHRLMHPKIGTIRTHLQIGTHSIDTSESRTVVELVDDAEQDEVDEEEPEDPDRYMSTVEVAELLNVSRSHAHRLLRTGEIPGVIDTSSGTERKTPRVRRSDLLAWVDSRQRDVRELLAPEEEQ